MTPVERKEGARGLLEEPVCNICGATETKTVFERGGDLCAEGSFVPTTDAFQKYGRVVECVQCGVARLSPRQQWSFLRQVYSDSQDPLYLAEHSGRRGSARKIVRFLEGYVMPGTLLDVGCGAGVLLAVARDKWRVRGVELCSWAVREARSRFALEVYEGTIAEARFPGASFDAVTMLDVIEHLPNPRETVAEAFRVLRPGGILFVLTPDIGSLVARVMGSWWWGLRPAHLYYFKRRNLTALLEREGFEVRAVRHWGRKFTLGYWISRMRGYAPGPVDLAGALARLTMVGRIPLSINALDSIGVVAMKRVS